ncbi:MULTISPECIES: GNAT family N-acetyltransferase [unclassified Microbacterium]|uniref:GNAT family N-acetyltransferase n=1 Tax=Microbacterium TaxID=33882 RepID=UPI003BA2D87C
MNALPDEVIPVREGVALTAFASDDAAAIHAAVDDVEIRRWLPLPRPYPLELAADWSTRVAETIRASGSGLVRCIREGERMAGCIDVKRVDWRARTAELGYWLSPAHRGRGLAAGAVDALASWLIDAQAFERVELRIATGNAASTRVAERAGFVYEGTARNAGFTDGGRVDLGIWSRIASGRR